jgi:hypothetical protein
MWNRILTKFLGIRSPKNTLAAILSDPFQREGFLGVRRDPAPSPERIIQDNERVIRYARTDEYSVWANEAWANVLNCVDKLIDPNLPAEEVDFYRGSLAARIDDLRISYKAILSKRDAEDISKNQSKV